VLVVLLPPLPFGWALFANFNDLRTNLRALTQRRSRWKSGESTRIKRLEPLIGEREMEPRIPNMPAPPPEMRVRTTFEWLSREQFVVQLWEVSGGVAPDGIAIVRAGPHSDGFLQHYFDSRGIARLYKMRFADGVWQLRPESADFSPHELSQRFHGTLSEDARTIERVLSGRPGSSERHGAPAPRASHRSARVEVTYGASPRARAAARADATRHLGDAVHNVRAGASIALEHGCPARTWLTAAAVPAPSL
jgi:hypothetical protein